ncbi:GNAT family N-acetyltransferase [Owenweeksia hongkongensis]|uniref:GNAT family N-acetyltransferase n=1 Tax=Owenweeksia hongkongensis TaxID=253245 RepID=UPI003A8C9F59
MEIEIQHEQKSNAGEFFIAGQGEERIGKLDYILFGSGRLVIQHTEVGKELQGKGAASKLVDAAAEHARNKGMKIVPVCPFAKKYMTTNRDKFGDVLA